MERLVTFIKEARIELKKVTWPTRQATINSTISVIVVSAAVALFLGILDFLFQFVLDKFVL
ncbi:MAG: preprotein translocase subunit SecE [Candidatus Sungbacteria bacterium GWC2_49_10]|uniref:Protein translocase subunit SecE n=2 Tax=Parcubacteria group TaxID=1794811 RepID=A0A0G1ZQA5_9BACT|nr:MAG: Preprotein translocase, SecE subunit [Parcubacteria group bacterium GW2011_GWB1_50_9]KKW21624.1 MAG: Preprotein translocase, SecE subunit [Candidatus Adlerbacteria bacterium GW2011_GWC1_50_9]OGZ94481.1 MAG: preprotein translocase subunit SecE [Candidatus Sungbacteria bacterium GWC2_49_10]